MVIDAKQVADLRRRTHAGLMDCKRALLEAKGEVDKAIDLLKEWGIAKAAKKGDRGASEGRLSAIISKNQDRASLIEINCETDFVANNKDFIQFAQDVSQMIFDAGITDSKDLTKEIQDKIAMGISTFGENIIVGSIDTISGPGVFGAYIHTNGKNGTIVRLEGEFTPGEELNQLAKDIAVHTSANSVAGIDVDDIDAQLLAERKAEFMKEAAAQGKPAAITEKIVEGKLHKFFKEETLLEQPYLKNEEITVKQHVADTLKKLNAQTLKVKQFVKKIIGE